MIQSAAVAPLMSIHDLGVHVDSDMSMHTIMQLVRSRYGVLRQLRSIRWSLTCSALMTLVTRSLLHRWTTAMLLWQVYHNVTWTECSLSSMQLLASWQMPANTTM